MALLGLLWLGRGRLGRAGSPFLVMTIGYAVIRFGLTSVRQETIVAFGLQEAQLVALATGLLAVVLLTIRAVRAQPSRTAVS